MRKAVSTAALVVMVVTGTGCGTRVARTSDQAQPASAADSSIDPGGVAQVPPGGTEAASTGPAPPAGGGTRMIPESPASAAAAGKATSAAPASTTGASGGTSSGGGGPGTPASGREAGRPSGAAVPPGPSRPAVPAPPAADRSPIVIGSVGNYSGVVGAIEGPGVQAAQVWVKAVNDRGGINGHPVQYIVVDDGSDPARHRAAVQDLVENRKVVAFVSQWANITHQGASEYIRQKRIPVIGGDVAVALWHENPMYFPNTADYDTLMWGQLQVGLRFQKGRKLGTLVCAEAEGCRQAADLVAKHAKPAGYDLVYQGQASVAAPDMTAQCLAAKGAGVDALYLQSDFNSQKRVAASCARQGFRPEYILSAPSADFVKVAEFNGAVTATQVFPFPLDAPATREYREAVARYSPNLAFSVPSSSGWVSGKLFEHIAGRVTGPITTPAILEVLWSTAGETLGGLTTPLSFVRDKPAPPSRCIFAVVQRDGRYEAPQGLTPICRS